MVPCNLGPCSVDCQWGVWQQWSLCARRLEHKYLNLGNIEETFGKIKERIIAIENSKIITGVKKTLLLSCAISGYDNPYEVDSVLERINKIYLRFNKKF